MHNKFLSLALLLLSVFTISVSARTQTAKDSQKSKRKVILTQYVKDSFTGVKLPAFVTLMRADCTVIDTATCKGWDRDLVARFQVEASPALYIVKAECKGYATVCGDYNLKTVARNRFFKMPDLQMKKLADSDIYKKVDLDGVVVTGTKVKFTYRGDTLVYNASAFNLPDGSMLDALVRQLPGAELKSNGDIYINGQKIDYLTLNGKDFFKGNNRIMLDNLPHYVVKELKVYDKSTKMSKFIGRDVEKKDHVMDVALKREYNRGYIANGEVAGGTRDRYMARLFGLYYDDYTRLSLFGNMNNVNENRRPGYNGDWNPANMPQGQTVTKQTGLSLNTRNKASTLEEQLDATLTWNDATDITRSASESFSSDGNIFSRLASASRQKDMRLNASNTLTYNNESTMYVESSTSVSYSDGSTGTSTRRATYDSDPKSAGGIIAALDSTFSVHDNNVRSGATNRSRNTSWRKFKSTTLSEIFLIGGKLPWGDVVSMSIEATYSTHKPQQSFSLSDNEYVRSGESDLRHIYADTHSRAYTYVATADYRIPLGSWNISIMQGYRQNYNSSNNLNYRLERLCGDYAIYDDRNLSMLPSTRDSLQAALDWQNSSTYRLLTRAYQGNAGLSYNKEHTLFILSLPYRLENERVNYEGSLLDTTAVRKKWLFEPSVYYSAWNDKVSVNASYGITSQQPDLVSLMPVENSLNPLARRISNPNLKASTTHSTNVRVRIPSKKGRLEMVTNGSLTTNMTGTRTVYDRTTGAYTYMADNVHSGNWNVNASVFYNRKLDKKGLLSIDNNLSANYTKSTDFDIAYDDAAASALSRVYTSVLGDNVNLSYQKGALYMSATAEVNWRHSTSSRANFQTLDVFDYNYGMTLSCKLPLGLQLATDLKQYSRRGYGESSMNTDDLVWNASLTRSFCKGRLTLKAEAFDILHQLSNTTYTVNAQARTEVWHNSIPNYCMMHVMYRITRSPKNK